MTVQEIRELIKDLPDNTPIRVNTVWDEDVQDLTPTECDGFYHEKDRTIYLTPSVISI